MTTQEKIDLLDYRIDMMNEKIAAFIFYDISDVKREKLIVKRDKYQAQKDALSQ